MVVWTLSRRELFCKGIMESGAIIIKKPKGLSLLFGRSVGGQPCLFDFLTEGKAPNLEI